MRLSIAPQSLLSADAYLFTAQRDIFPIDVRIKRNMGIVQGFIFFIESL